MLLNDAEEKYDAGQAAMAKKEYDALEPAPYLELLPEYGEIEVELASDKEHALIKDYIMRRRERSQFRLH